MWLFNSVGIFLTCSIITLLITSGKTDFWAFLAVSVRIVDLLRLLRAHILVSSLQSLYENFSAVSVWKLFFCYMTLTRQMECELTSYWKLAIFHSFFHNFAQQLFLDNSSVAYVWRLPKLTEAYDINNHETPAQFEKKSIEQVSRIIMWNILNSLYLWRFLIFCGFLSANDFLL